MVIELARHIVPRHVLLHDLRERFILRREMLEDQQKRDHPVISIKVLTKIVMPAQLTGEQPILLPHTIFHERMTTLRNDRPPAFSPHGIERGPNHARIEDDRVVAAILRQQDIGLQRRDIRARDEFTFLVEEHRAVGVSIPRDSERRLIFSHEFLSLSSIAWQHRIGWSFRERSIRLEVQRDQIQSELFCKPCSRSTHKTEVRIPHKRELLDLACIDRLQNVLYISVEYVALALSSFFVRLDLSIFAGFEHVSYLEQACIG